MGMCGSSFAPVLTRPFFCFRDTPTTQIYTLSLHDALPISSDHPVVAWQEDGGAGVTEVRVQRWTGSAWAAVGTGTLVDTAGKNSFTPSLVLDPARCRS